MRWDDVQLFLAIARSTNQSEASTRLGISPSTVSRRLAALEARSNGPLFVRTPTGYTTTEAGRVIFDAALRMEANHLELTRKLATHETLARQIVRLSAPDVLINHLGPSLAALRAAEPQILLELDVDNSPVDLDRLEADVALRASRMPQPHLMGTRVAYTAWAAYVARSRRKAAVGDEGLSWIGYAGPLESLPVTHWLRENVPDERIAFRTNSTVAAQLYAREGIGAACLWCLAGDQDPELVRLTGPLPGVASDLWLLTHPDLRRSGPVVRVRAFLANAVRAERRLLEGRGA